MVHTYNSYIYIMILWCIYIYIPLYIQIPYFFLEFTEDDGLIFRREIPESHRITASLRRFKAGLPHWFHEGLISWLLKFKDKNQFFYVR